MMDFNRWLSFSVGLVVTLTGLIPLLNALGLISVSLAAIPWVVFSVITVFGGFYLIIDGIWDMLKDFTKVGLASVIFGLIVATMGTVPILALFGLTVPVIGTILTLTTPIANYLYVVCGILLLWSGYITGWQV